MRIPLLRTLSGRIILGFTVLTLAFGTISALIVYYMEVLSRDIRLIRTGYVPLALAAQDLEQKQKILWSYIFDELEEESDPERARTEIIKYQQGRMGALRQVEKVLTDLTDVPLRHRRYIAEITEGFDHLDRAVEKNSPHYRVIQSTPPIKAWKEREDLTPAQRAEYQEARATLALLTTAEANLWPKMSQFSNQQSKQARQTALYLEKNQKRLRIFAVVMGLLAVLVGLLVTIWATVTLRPLNRLRDGARRIAEGEYKSRISERGPAEVADLAREFNIMGRAIEERERELVRQERLVAVGKMAAMVTHEVRNPLSAIGLNAELLEEEIVESADFEGREEASTLCRAITAEVDRLTEITEEYLQFARLPKPKLQAEEVNAIARSLADFQREPLAQRGVELSCDLADDLPEVLVDHSQLRQALLNLLRNAAEAVISEHGEGRVTLASRVLKNGENTMVELSVGDTGPGVPEELMSRLFDPFVSSKDGGTGLGLALTHQIIREHGGDIRVESAPGQGATFVIALPAS